MILLGLMSIRRLLQQYWVLLIVTLVSLSYLSFRLGASTLWDFDEANYAAIARNIVRSNEWVTLRWNLEPWLLKPPLFFWLTAISFKVFGINEFAARFVSVVSATGVVLLTMLLIEKVTQNKKIALLSVGMLLASSQFVLMARNGTTDMLLTLLITTSFFFGVRAIENKSNYWSYLLVGCSVGLAVLTKNIIGFFPLGVLGLYGLVTGEWKNIRWRHVLLLVASLMVVALPWHIAAYLKNGQQFINIYFLDELMKRATSDFQGHPAPVYWYAEVLIQSFKPFIFLLPIVAFINVLDFLKGNKRLLLFMLWPTLLVAFFSLSKDKLAWYILPVYPALIVMIGAALNRMLHYPSEYPATKNYMFFAATAGLLLGYLHFEFKMMALILLVFTALFLLGVFWLSKMRVSMDARIMESLFVLVLLVSCALNWLALPSQPNANMDLKNVCSDLELNRNSTKLFLIGFYFQGPTYYCDLKNVRMIRASEITETLPAEGETFLYLIKSSDFESNNLDESMIFRKSGDVYLLKRG